MATGSLLYLQQNAAITGGSGEKLPSVSNTIQEDLCREKSPLGCRNAPGVEIAEVMDFFFAGSWSKAALKFFTNLQRNLPRGLENRFIVKILFVLMRRPSRSIPTPHTH